MQAGPRHPHDDLMKASLAVTSKVIGAFSALLDTPNSTKISFAPER